MAESEVRKIRILFASFMRAPNSFWLVWFVYELPLAHWVKNTKHYYALIAACFTSGYSSFFSQSNDITMKLFSVSFTDWHIRGGKPWWEDITLLNTLACFRDPSSILSVMLSHLTDSPTLDYSHMCRLHLKLFGSEYSTAIRGEKTELINFLSVIFQIPV